MSRERKEIDERRLTKEERRALRLKKRRREIAIMRAVIAVVAILIIILAVVLIRATISGGKKTPKPSSNATTQTGTQDVTTNQNQDIEISDNSADGSVTADDASSGGDENTDDASADAPADEAAAPVEGDAGQALQKAALLAAGYDYDGAMELLRSVPDYDQNDDITSAITEYETAKSACVAVDPNSVPHIFYHSLVNDPNRAFNASVLGQGGADGMNAWMTTVEEFDKITQQLYDRGYVYVRLRDLVVESVGEDGKKHFTPNTNLMLPPDKKAIVLSVDDLSYYHSYKPAGFPEKLVLDENGLVKCRYTDADGNTTVGDYDVVPRLNTFLREHPDGAYHGARGMIAMTGYDGVFGYRTDIDYELRERLTPDQSQWLEEHPDFNRQTEIEEATVIADAIKNEGWEFASHTWGHLSVTQVSADKLLEDNKRWVENVGNIVGDTDIIIFAHGNDIGDWQEYAPDNDKYNALKGAGYNYYCNVDGSVPYWVQIRSDYVRQGRIDLDGYMLYRATQGETTVLNDLIDAASVFDQRRPTPVVANGQG